MAYTTKIKQLNEKDLIKVNVDRLKINKPLPFDVYIQEAGIRKKLFNKGIVFSNVFLSILKEKGINQVYIEKSDEKALDTYPSKLTTEPELELPIAFKNYSFHKENFYQIDRKLLIPETELNFSVYVLKNLKFTKIVDASPEQPAMIYDKTIPEEGDILLKKKTCLYSKNTLNF